MVDDKTKDDDAKEEDPKPVDEDKVEKPEEAAKDSPEEGSEVEEAEEPKETEPKPEPEPDTDEPDAKEDKTPEFKDEIIEPKLTNEYRLPSSATHKPLHHHSVKRLLSIIAFVLVLALFAGAVIWLTHDDPVSTNESEIVYSQGAAVTAVEGEVEYNSGAGWELVESGVNIKESDSVRTLEESRAIITLDDGSAVRLNSDTSVTFVKLTADEVIVDNDGGEVYVRVSASDTRKFYVYVNDQAYLALGTAYKTTNSTDDEGVEVYHSKVKTNDSESKEIEVAEGEAFYSKSKDVEQVNKISKLDIEKLKDDDFLKWNKTKDEAEKEFADKLGFLAGIDTAKKEEEKKEVTPAPAPASSPNGISATGAKVDNGIKVSWSVKGVDTSDGFKIAYSRDDTTPSYGENSAKYVNSSASSQVLELTDGKVWHIRVCAYRGDGVCDSYSNTVSVTAPYKEKEKVDVGTVETTAWLDGTKIRWSYDGTAPYGFKVTWSIAESPEYGKDSAKLVSKDVNYLNLDEQITESGTYYVRVCKYTSGTQTDPCVDYSPKPGVIFTK